MKIDLKKKENVIVIYPPIKIDKELSIKLEEKILSTIRQYPKSDILINMRTVNHINSSSLNGIIKGLIRLRENNRLLKISNVNESVLDLFRIVNLEKLINKHSLSFVPPAAKSPSWSNSLIDPVTS